MPYDIFGGTLYRKEGLKKIANKIGEKCTDEEIDEIIEYWWGPDFLMLFEQKNYSLIF